MVSCDKFRGVRHRRHGDVARMSRAWETALDDNRIEETILYQEHTKFEGLIGWWDVAKPADESKRVSPRSDELRRHSYHADHGD